MLIRSRKQFPIWLLMLLILFTFGCGSGPNLLSESATKRLVVKCGELVSVESVELQTSGPIYRVVFGQDKDGNHKAVWVGREIVYSVLLSSGISEQEASVKAKEIGIEGPYRTKLIYVPVGLQDIGKPEGVYWWITGQEKDAFIRFTDGEVIRTIQKELGRLPEKRNKSYNVRVIV